MKKIGTFIALLVICISCQTEKTGYVDTEKLLTDYNEMTQAKERYTKESNAIQNSFDLRIQGYQIKEDLFVKNRGSMNQSKQQEKINELTAEAQLIQQERQDKLGKLQVESQAVIDSLITKVKDKVKAYGTTNGYSYIYGSNDAGSVLFGKEELDLTNTILNELNEAYTSSKNE